ncbi:MAG TPA: PAS domain S-box protein [Steroidobacteraceae bacterium]|nr:PAS domain S-box protein [Steroidobacteraceae bacterium]
MTVIENSAAPPKGVPHSGAQDATDALVAARLYPGGPESLGAPADIERRFRLFVQKVEDYAIFMLDPDGRVCTWNEGAERLKGYQARDIIGQHLSRFYTPEDLECGLPQRLLESAAAQGHAESEGWRVRKDGSLFWAKVSITAIREEGGLLVGFGKVTRDLTERRHAEEALKELSSSLVEDQDRERRRISLSLSDSTSPSFATLLTKLHLARSRSEREARDLIDDCVALAEYLSREIRTVSYTLYPPSLDSEGLLAALQAYLKAVAQHKGIRIDTDLPARLDRVTPPVAAALYRVVHDFLENMLRHPGGSRVVARIAVRDGRLTLEVGAEGCALSRQALQEARRGVGELGVALAGMRERLRRFAGSVRIDSRNFGTWITAVVPVPATP